MQFFDPNNPNERKKMIAAAILGVGAIIVLGYVFLGGSSKPTTTNKNVAAKSSPSPSNSAKTTPVEPAIDDSSTTPLPNSLPPVPAVAEANRNIFAFYEPPPPTPKPVIIPTPSPTPVPPMAIRSLNPSNVYARTADFSLEVAGEKFTPAVRIIIDGRELPTRFISAQQLFTTVPAALISSPGVRQVMARTSDGKLYSLSTSLNVAPPPLPNYNYVGIIGKPRANDNAILQEKGSKDLLNVQRGDVLGGRFRVSSISEREVVLVDTTLKIRHTLPFTIDSSVNQQQPPPRQPVRVTTDEP